MRRWRERLDDLGRRRVLTDPARPLREWQRRLDDLGGRLQRGLVLRRRQAGERLERAARALRPELLRTHVRHEARHLDQLRGRLERAAREAVGRRRRAMAAVAGQLDSLSPLACLARGYSICTLPSGEVVTRAGQVSPGASVAVRLREGALECRVEETRDGGD